MRTFAKTCAQGDIYITRIERLPKEAVVVAADAGRVIVTHSETGHHHVMERNAGAAVTVLDKAPEGMRVLHAILAEPNKLIHERGHDTHETIDLPAGEYEFRIAREFDHYAELARQSAD